ncbi:carbonic anhydrase family protein [Bythopirellula goksoeyrii]|uniref:Carbonic anhydrase 2 n=1 Tax=Bythopirellula goksoeyrii TaxID=1400387 RepID=A0A5B9Q8N1_9BACT|nr:carbonic anhydrase family protein [Bythopirellula goksoeyrii]QEG35434.1 Carbonic anhydrase 2 [Bythopirellula goksoeyrii]
MMVGKHLCVFITGSFSVLLMTGDVQGQDHSKIESAPKPLVVRVLTREEQEKLTPDDVIELLKNGNKRFTAGTLTSRDHSKMIREAALNQFPKAVILSCLDSRIPVEDVFDRGIGDIFVARVAGNFANTDILGSMEFACKVSGSKLVFVLGHEHCGAIKGAIDGVELGNITPMLANISPAVDHFAAYEGDKSSENEELVDMVAEKNVRMTVENIRRHSPILKEMEANGEIKIVGGMYDMNSGEVHFFDK